MKKLTLLKLCAFFLTFVFFSVDLSAQANTRFVPPHPGIGHLVLEDIDNNTQGRCQVTNDGRFYFNFSVSLSHLVNANGNTCLDGETCYIPDTVPPLYLRYNVNGDISNPILLSTFTRYQSPQQHSHDEYEDHVHNPVLYKHTISTSTYSQSPICDWVANPTVPVTLELLTLDNVNGFVPYPVQQYNNDGEIFDCKNFEDICCGDGYQGFCWPNYNPTVISANIPVCCENFEERGFREKDAEDTQNTAHSYEHGHQHAHINNLKVNPNPFDDYLLLEYNLTASAQVNIQIVDLNGRVLKSIANTQNEGRVQERINTSDLAKGIYHCIVELEDGHSELIKVVKMK